jgi:hypothetical protein
MYKFQEYFLFFVIIRLFSHGKWNLKSRRGGVSLFDITESAHKILQNAIKQESNAGEKLFVRLTMAIG